MNNPNVSDECSSCHYFPISTTMFFDLEHKPYYLCYICLRTMAGVSYRSQEEYEKFGVILREVAWMGNHILSEMKDEIAELTKTLKERT